jgi:parallel beta-helix repeat protein
MKVIKVYKKVLRKCVSILALTLGLMVFWCVDADSSTTVEEPVVLESVMLSSSVEDFGLPGRVAGVGTQFQVIDSVYMNLDVDSSEAVNMSVESVPEMITIEIEPADGATSTVITVGGLEPFKTYYKYEDNYHNRSQVETDADGYCSYVQDLSKKHFVFIQPRPSTKFIPSDPDIGIWDPGQRIYTLTTNVNETIQIDEDNLTLDGAGYSVTGSATGHGIYMADRVNVVVTNLNISNFTNGIYMNNCSGSSVSLCDSTGNSYGVYMTGSSSNDITANTMDSNIYGIYLTQSTGNTVEDNSASFNSTHGIYLNTQNNTNVILGNTVESNTDCGIMVSYDSGSNELSCNTLTDNETGIEVYDCADSLIFDNSVNANQLCGINLSYSSFQSEVAGNVLSNNYRGLYMGQFCNNNDVYNNNFIGNTIQAEAYAGTVNAFNRPSPTGGNHWNEWTTPDDNADGIVDVPYSITGAGTQDTLPFVDALTIVCGTPPIAEAGPAQLVVAGDTVILDGSDSYDPEGLDLTHLWTFTTVPSGSAAVIYDETLEQAYFVPDEAGDYVVSLVVNNGELDSEPDEVTITAISMVDAAVMNLEDAVDYVNSLSVQVFLRSSSKKLLVSKINNALGQISTGDYAGAASYLNRFVLSKVDGCQKGGSPDRTDLILSCPEQEVVYNLVSEAIDLLEAAS